MNNDSLLAVAPFTAQQFPPHPRSSRRVSRSQAQQPGSKITRSKQNSRFTLLNLPFQLLDSIARFCGENDIIALEKMTGRSFKNIWITYILQYNLFLCVSRKSVLNLENRKFTIEQVDEYYKIDLNTIQSEEDQIEVIEDPYSDQELSTEIKNQVFNTNRFFLNQFSTNLRMTSHLPQKKKLLASLSPTFLTRLENLRNDNAFRQIYFQLQEQQRNLFEEGSDETPAKLNQNKSLKMLMQAQTSGHLELFGLLQNFRAHQCDRSREYHRFNNFLLIKEVMQTRPKMLKSLITALNIDEININNQFSDYRGTALRAALEIFDSENSRKTAKDKKKGKVKQIQVVEVLLAAKANPKERDLMPYAISRAHSLFEALNLLIAHKANVNEIENGETPLGLALLSSQTLSIKTRVISNLVRAGADVNGLNFNCQTPLHVALDFYQTEDKIIQLLIDKGAKRSLGNNFGETPLMKAVTTKRNLGKIKILLAPIKKKFRGKEPLESKEEEIDVNQRDHSGNTALMYAVSRCNYPKHLLPYVETLLQAKADVNLLNYKRKSAFTLAKKRNLSNEILNLLKTDQPQDLAVNHRKRKLSEMESDSSDKN